MNIVRECSRFISFLLELKQSGKPLTRQIVNAVIDRQGAIEDALYKQGRPKRPRHPKRRTRRNHTKPDV